MGPVGQGPQSATEIRSILKKSKPDPNLQTQSRDQRNRETALYHADLLQHRKDIEYSILCSLEALIDLPFSKNADPQQPSNEDVVLVNNTLKPFQPSDYDALVKERNINRRCGYVFCPRPNRVEETSAKFRILRDRSKGSDGVSFVHKEFLERWCSNDCGKRALYIRVQLNEEPAWTRDATSNADLVILQNRQSGDDGTGDLLKTMQNLDLGSSEEEALQKLKALAIERGDNSFSSRGFGLTEAKVKENQKGAAEFVLQARPSAATSDTGMMIEGYLPKGLDQHSIASRDEDGDEGADFGTDLIDMI